MIAAARDQPAPKDRRKVVFRCPVAERRERAQRLTWRVKRPVDSRWVDPTNGRSIERARVPNRDSGLRYRRLSMSLGKVRIVLSRSRGQFLSARTL